MKKKTGNNNQPATKKDLKQLEQKLSWRVGGVESQMKSFRNELSAHKIARELRLDNQQEQTKELITGFKDEILGADDGVMHEIETMRQENIISTDMKRQVNEHEERLETVEEKLGISSLAA